MVIIALCNLAWQNADCFFLYRRAVLRCWAGELFGILHQNLITELGKKILHNGIDQKPYQSSTVIVICAVHEGGVGIIEAVSKGLSPCSATN